MSEDPIQLKEGDKFEASFNIKGNPAPGVFFYKDEEPLEDCDRVKITNKGTEWKLCFPSLKEEDSGLYIVEAENESGLIEKEFDLDVTGELFIAKCLFFLLPCGFLSDRQIAKHQKVCLSFHTCSLIRRYSLLWFCWLMVFGSILIVD